MSKLDRDKEELVIKFEDFKPPELSVSKFRAFLDQQVKKKNKIMAFRWTKRSLEFATELMDTTCLDDSKRMSLMVTKKGFLLVMADTDKVRKAISTLLKKHHMIALEEKGVPFWKILSELT
jgi:hypothetical protein